MNQLLPETIKAAKELRNEFKCLSCHQIPSEPYFTGVCDHLMCLSCISKSNLCPICNISFYKNESHLNKMIKEAILYVNNILEITEDKNEQDDCEPSSLPDIKLFDEENYHRPIQKVSNPSTSSDRDTFLKPITNKCQPSQSKPRTKSTGRRAVKKDIPIDVETASQRPRSQSVRNKLTKRNDKGEQPIHLAVMNGDLIELNRLLNEESVDVNVKDFAGWSPLHEACNKGNLEMVKLLIEHNADINAFGY